MRRSIEIALVALALTGAPLATVVPTVAHAEVGISINPGIVAFGYRDGYWDRGRQWHAWHNQEDTRWYQTHNADHYFDREHHRDKDMGWRDDNRWWEREHR